MMYQGVIATAPVCQRTEDRQNIIKTLQKYSIHCHYMEVTREETLSEKAGVNFQSEFCNAPSIMLPHLLSNIYTNYNPGHIPVICLWVHGAQICSFIEFSPFILLVSWAWLLRIQEYIPVPMPPSFSELMKMNSLKYDHINFHD